MDSPLFNLVDRIAIPSLYHLVGLALLFGIGHASYSHPKLGLVMKLTLFAIVPGICFVITFIWPRDLQGLPESGEAALNLVFAKALLFIYTVLAILMFRWGMRRAGRKAELPPHWRVK